MSRGETAHERDLFNLEAAESPDGVDALNREFYGRFNFPWPPASFEAFVDPRFGVRALNQDIGDWRHERVPRAPRIWVAGCGTNQAVYTSLRFPESEVTGTDVSVRSVAVCRRSAAQVGADRLTLQEGSIRKAEFEDAFDFVQCTGVIHHNAVPKEPLEALARALKPDGVLELMVYNYYHRLHTTAYQNAIRLLTGSGAEPDFDTELKLTNTVLADGIEGCPSMSRFLQDQTATTEAELADSLLQPVEYSYTVASFAELADACGLEMLLPCANQFDKAEGRLAWTLRFDDPAWCERYDALSDVERWQLANLLRVEASPMLWFYFQRKDSTHTRRSERQILDTMLDTRFAKNKTLVERHLRGEDGSYTQQPGRDPFPVPAAPTDELARRVYDQVDPAEPLRVAFDAAGVEPSVANASHIRVHLTTSLFPYLKSLPDDE